MKKLIIGQPYIENNRLCSKIKSEKTEYIMWFQVEEEYIKYLCYERADAFLIALIPYFIKHEMDVSVEAKVSSRLYYQLTRYLIPLLCNNFKKRKPYIKCELDNSVFPSGNAVGTGISCGIDSFYTICKHTDSKEKMFNITHLTFFNAGSNGQFGGEEARKLYNIRKEKVRKFAIQNNYKFVCVDSNMNEFIMMNHEKTHTFRSVSCVMALQKLFSKYYYSSGLDFNKTRIDEFDTATYDILNMQCLSNDNVNLYCPGIEVTRIEKVKEISEYEVTYNWLNVCVREGENCCKCEKCIRTLLELDAIGQLKKYEKVFDLNIFSECRNKYLIFMLKNKRKKNIFYNEIFNEYKQKNIKIPAYIYLISYFPNKQDIKDLIKNIFPKKIVDSIKRKRNKYCDDGWF